MWLVSIKRFSQGLSIAIENVRIVKELMEIWSNEVCDIYYPTNYNFRRIIRRNKLHNCQISRIWQSPDSQYLLRQSVQSWFHYSLEYFVIHFCLEWVLYAFSKILANYWTKVSRFSLLLIADMLRLCTPQTSEVIKSFSFLLSVRGHFRIA